MAVHLQFEGIRCFSSPQDAVIRPLTLLVGENSSGKTTFLALCRLAHALALESIRHLPFNEPPFLLGAYEQIASNRGGRARANSSFSVAITLGDLSQQSLRAEFVSQGGQASLQLLRLASGNLHLEVVAGADKRIITLRGSRREEKYPAGSKSQIPDVPEWLLLSVMHTPVPRQEWVPLGQKVFSNSDLEELESA